MLDDETLDPLEDARRGFGLLFRAEKAAVEKLRTKAEKPVLQGARELGRAVASVGKSLEKQFRKESDAPKGEPPKDARACLDL